MRKSHLPFLALVIALFAACAPQADTSLQVSKMCPERLGKGCEEPFVFSHEGELYSMDYIEYRAADLKSSKRNPILIKLPDGRFVEVHKWLHSNPVQTPHNAPTYRTPKYSWPVVNAYHYRD